MKLLKQALLLAILLTIGVGLNASDKGKDKKAKMVDSGSFGIFVNGTRVGTETFHIEQTPEYGLINSEIKIDDGKNKATQSAEMQVMANGELRSYSWHSTLPQKEESSVEPKDQFLVEHIVPVDQKKTDVPHILPLSTVILDDNFFSQREVLVWRYLASGCLSKPDGLSCGPSHFGIFVPHQHTSADVTLELIGRDKTKIKDAEQELNKLKLTGEESQWFLWVTDDYKLLKIVVTGSNVEVVRD